MLREKMEGNSTMICLDFSQNNIGINDSLALQEKVKANKSAYDEARKEEWLERKGMEVEEHFLREKFIEREARKLKEQVEEDQKAEWLGQMDIKWKKIKLEQEIERQNII